MFKIQNLISNVLTSGLVVVLFSIGYINFTNPNFLEFASASAQEIEVPIDRSESIKIYFPYGDFESENDVLNAQASISLSGEGFEFETEGFYDMYFTSVENNPPQIAVCNPESEGFDNTIFNELLDIKYQINSNLISNNNLTYGFQSANTNNTGNSKPATLPKKYTGCIRVELKLKDDAKIGQETTLIYDQDSANSESYTDITRPLPREIKFIVSEAENN